MIFAMQHPGPSPIINHYLFIVVGSAEAEYNNIVQQ